ncbi:MAG: elongation factor G [Rhodospirillales bacterium]|nr:elongation factor G [Rhodospirillales bacterium]
MPDKTPSAPRCAALVGPYLSGKTTLLESLVSATGAVNRKGAIKEGNTVGDSTPEARARQMSTELNVASTEYLGDQWTFIDCPGSVELSQDAMSALMVVDTAVIVCESEEEKALTVAPLLKFLDDHKIPHIIFINKMDVPGRKVRATLEALQEVSERPLILREIPMRNGDEIIGLVDLVSERAWKWNPGKPSDLIQVPDELNNREQKTRGELLESLADFDDTLLEELLEDTVPSTDEIYSNLTTDLHKDLIVPVIFGSAEQDHGIQRLLKLLRHEAPEPAITAKRLGLNESDSGPVVQVFKTLHGSQTGKMSLARIMQGEVTDGMNLDGSRVSGLFSLLGSKQNKLSKAASGEVVALGRMENVHAGDLLTATDKSSLDAWPQALSPLYALTIHAEHRSDEVKLSGALTKLVEEDPSLTFEHNPDTSELLLWGQGETHLQIAIDRLKNRYSLGVTSTKPQVPYKETITKSISHHARHKKQSGGHGQFGDVHVEIKPLPRGSGFEFNDTITGGVVPKQYIPAVEHGVRDYMSRGPFGFPVVDFAVTLTDGQFHAVDSSDMAFRAAAQLAMREAMPKCGPVLLEPIFKVDISLPSEFTSKVQRLVSGRRGQILGFDAKPGWNGWDEVSVQLPQSEIFDLINELRSLTLGVGTFKWKFDHLQELTGKIADKIIADRAESKK